MPFSHGPAWVASFMDAWIETPTHVIQQPVEWRQVASFMDAWIETASMAFGSGLGGSHPSWMRGLKRYSVSVSSTDGVSHPSWMRGLKHPMTFAPINR